MSLCLPISIYAMLTVSVIQKSESIEVDRVRKAKDKGHIQVKDTYRSKE